jgi:hypothetical protein
MATSGSFDFGTSRDEIINGALKDCGLLLPNQQALSDHVADASVTLNFMLKAWQNYDIGLWLTKEATLFPTVDKYGRAYGRYSNRCG